MANTHPRETSTVLDELRAFAQRETGSRRSAAERIIARLKAAQPQIFRDEAHARLACHVCLRLPCRCGTPRPPSFDDVLRTQAQRRGQ